MKLICKAEFKNMTYRFVTGQFDLSVDGFITMVAFIRVSMKRGAERTTITDGAVSVPVETSRKWMDMDGMEMAGQLAELVADTIKQDIVARRSAPTASQRSSETRKKIGSTD